MSDPSLPLLAHIRSYIFLKGYELIRRLTRLMGAHHWRTFLAWTKEKEHTVLEMKAP